MRNEQQTTFEKAVELFWRGHPTWFVGQQLGYSHLDAIDDAKHFVAEKKQNAADTAHKMFRAGARHGEVLSALRDLGLPAYDTNEISLHAMAVVRRERAKVEETK